ncbi:MAG: GGDEF domain-containing protein [Lachnospiraceae bacterium]|nr:GGDEF domain-containing protein [Lachnospiraceae bacterium]
MKEKKKLTRKTVLKAALIVYALLSLYFTTSFIDGMFSRDYTAISQYLPLNDAWDITINERSWQNVSLDAFRFAPVNKGDTIIMERTFPADTDCTGHALVLQIRQAAVTVYLDGEQIHQYGWDRIDGQKTVGSGYLPVDLPDNYAAKTLTLAFTVAEDKAFSRFDPIRVYEWKNIYRVILTENRIPLFLGCFLTIFGLVTCCITIFALLFSGKFSRVLCVSLFSVCIGLWTLCYYNVLLIFAMPLYTICLLEYLTLYLAPIPLIIYMREDVLALNRPLMYTVYRILLTVQIMVTAVFLGLHSIDLVHCAATLKYMQVLILCNLVYFIIVEFMNLRITRQLVHRLFLIGMLLLSGCVSYDLVFYYFDRYLGIAISSTKGIASVGLVIFIFLLLVSFYLNLTQKMMQETERNFLIKSAYTDELTQIHNRRYCMEYMTRVKEKENPHYTVFCFDLNNLKITNDTYGHAQGDILIRSAANVIVDAFEPHGIVARMGGDEFIAIVETDDSGKISSMIGEFRSGILRKNEEIPDLHLSIAYGYASCSPKECNIEKIYQLADDRMYENKQAIKNSGARALDSENAKHSPERV